MSDASHRHVRGYAICSAARSGTNFLKSLLHSTGVLGYPNEYFNAPARRMSGIADYPDDPHEQLKQILTRGMTPNGVYALKIFPYQFDLAKATRWSETLPALSFVHLERTDLLGQAISKVKADQTDQWRSSHLPKGEARYDAAAIRAALRNAVTDQARWRLWFARTGIQPLWLRYEEVMADPQRAVDAVAALVGIEGHAAIKPEQLDFEIQRNAQSDEWRTRFIRECGRRAAF